MSYFGNFSRTSLKNSSRCSFGNFSWHSFGGSSRNFVENPSRICSFGKSFRTSMKISSRSSLGNCPRYSNWNFKVPSRILPGVLSETPSGAPSGIPVGVRRSFIGNSPTSFCENSSRRSFENFITCLLENSLKFLRKFL